MGYGFRMGRLLADAVCDGDPPEALDLFAASRFGAEQGSDADSSAPRPANS
jgi:glycine/D-amino acid oxidase-like deaminating enzyme